MPGGGTRTLLEPDHYEASLRQAQIEAVIVPRGKFKAHFTWEELHHLQVPRCEEDSSRVAYVQLAPGLAAVKFPAGSEALPVWRGREMQAGEIMFHSRRKRLHQSMPGPSVWNVIAMDPAQLERYGWALSGKLSAGRPTCCGACTRKFAACPDKIQGLVAFRGRARHGIGSDRDAGRLFDDPQHPDRRVRQPPSWPGS
jgi:hypothetical protein